MFERAARRGFARTSIPSYQTTVLIESLFLHQDAQRDHLLEANDVSYCAHEQDLNLEEPKMERQKPLDIS